jgi:hypothetical protein
MQGGQSSTSRPRLKTTAPEFGSGTLTKVQISARGYFIRWLERNPKSVKRFSEKLRDKTNT